MEMTSRSMKSAGAAKSKGPMKKPSTMKKPATAKKASNDEDKQGGWQESHPMYSLQEDEKPVLPHVRSQEGLLVLLLLD